MLAARATAPRSPRADQLTLRQRTWIGVLAGAMPDADIVFILFGHVSYMENHRGVTHSLLLMPVWAWLLALAVGLLLKRRGGWRACYGLILLVWFVHVLGDLITSYGTQILAPVTNWAPGLNTTFIIDPWFSGLLVVGLLGSVYWRPRAGAILGLTAVTALVLFQHTQYRAALAEADAWARSRGLGDYVAEALPQPWSPFNWKLVVEHDDRYHLATVNLRRTTPPRDAGDDAFALRRLWSAYVPVDQAQWDTFHRYGTEPRERELAREVMAAEEMAFFRWFARYPALRAVDRRDGDECVVFEDLRFRLEGIGNPFRYGMCRPDGGAEWQLYRMGDDGARTRL